MSDLIDRQMLLEYIHGEPVGRLLCDKYNLDGLIEQLPSAQPEIVRCKDCKHNPKHEWFGCPMSHLNEKQRPETAWCWKGERRTDDKTNKGSSC